MDLFSISVLIFFGCYFASSVAEHANWIETFRMQDPEAEDYTPPYQTTEDMYRE